MGKDPLVYEHGSNMIIKGLESQMEGMKAGDTKKVEVRPEDAYGPVKPEAFQEVSKDKIPPDALGVGAMFQVTGDDGSTMPLRVHEIKSNTVVVDFNHPLAGKSLTFDVKVLDVQ